MNTDTSENEDIKPDDVLLYGKMASYITVLLNNQNISIQKLCTLCSIPISTLSDFLYKGAVLSKNQLDDLLKAITPPSTETYTQESLTEKGLQQFPITAFELHLVKMRQKMKGTTT